MYSKYRKLLFICFLIIIAGCDLGCIGSNELGDEGEIDKFYVRSNSNTCSYSIGLKVGSNVHSSSINECLVKTLPSNAGVSQSLLMMLNDNGNTYTCDKYDNYQGIESMKDEVKTGINTDETAVANNLRKIFDVCLEYCQVKCFSDNGFSSSSVRSTNGGWVKNELYSNDSYYGITIDENSVININVSDKIFLKGDDENKFEFMNYYHKNGGSQSYIPVGSKGNLGLIYPLSGKDDSYFANVDKYVNIVNELRKNYIEINEYNSNSMNKQTVDYKSISSIYSEDQISGDQTSKSYRVNVTSGANLDIGYNTEIFEPGLEKDFYYYYQVSTILEALKFGKGDSGAEQECKFYGITNNDKSIEGFAIERTSNKKAYELTYEGYGIGYIWDDISSEDNSFTFSIDGPTKLAFKFIDNDSGCSTYNDANLTCNYTVAYSERTKENNIKQITFELKPSAKENKWYVLNNNNNKEVVLGETYDNIYLNGSDREITISTNNSSCARGLIINKLPSKEYEVEKSGYAFFHIPEYSGNNHQIYYNIINPHAFDVLDKDADVALNYYEFADDIRSFGEYYFENIQPLPKSGLSSLNEDGIGVEANYGFYVRKGQIIRFDYKSWFEFKDGKVSLKTWNYQGGTSAESTNLVEVPFGLNLLLLIKERPAYLCSGTKEETVDADSFCKMMGGNMESYKSPKTNESGDYEIKNNNVVYEKNDKCMADISGIDYCNFNAIYRKLYNFSNNITETNNEGNTSCTTKGIDNGEVKEISTACLVIPDGTVYGPLDVYSNILSLMPVKIKESIYCFKTNDKFDGCVDGDSDDGRTKIINDYIEQLKRCTEEIGKNSSYETSGFSGTLISVGTDATSVKTSLDSITKYLGGGSHNVPISEYDSEGKLTGNNTKIAVDIEPTAAVFLKTSGTEEGFLQCYTLENYLGSMYYFNEKNPTTHNTVLDDNLSKLGVTNIKSFLESNNGGLADAFISRRKHEDGMLFETSFIANKSVYLSTYVLNDDIPLKLSGYSFDTPKRTLLLNAQTSITTGDRLEIFMASNLINSSDLFNEYDGNIINTNEYSDNNPDGVFLWLVKYDADGLSNNSLYEFDKGGNLVEKGGGGIGINLKNGTESTKKTILNFINARKNKSVHDLVLYFKIKDVDPCSGSETTGCGPHNNSGQYYVKMTNYAANKNYVAEAFRGLINEVLSLMDGRSFNLEKNGINGKYVDCSDAGRCYIYSEDNVKDTGKECKKGDENCFASCDNLSTEDEFSNKCEYIYNNGGFLKLIYKYIIADVTYQFLIKLCLIAMLVFYGFGYFLGLNNFTQEELVKRMIRIVFVYTLISPFGWEIYDKYIVSFFKQGIDSLLYLIASGFEVGSSAVIDTYLMRGDFTDRNILFSSGYDNLKLIFSRPIFNKILGLVFSGWFGPIYFYLVLSAIISYCVGLISAIIMYISIQVFMSIILAIGPLIFFFLFFEKTKGTFDKWLDLLISFALQQIFIILTLSFFNSLIFMVIKHVFSYTVCWQSILPMNIFGSTLSLISFWKVPTSSTAASALDLQAAAKNGPGLYNIMLFYIIGTLMGKFVTNMADLANGLAGGVGITGFTKNITDKISGAGNQLKGLAKKGLKAPLNHANRKLNDWNKNVNEEYDKRKNNRTRAEDKKQMETGNKEEDKEEGKDKIKQNGSESQSGEGKPSASQSGGDKPSAPESGEGKPSASQSGGDKPSAPESGEGKPSASQSGGNVSPVQGDSNIPEFTIE